MCDNVKTKHHRQAGLYAREMELPKDWFAESHKHVFDHMSILSEGHVIVEVDGKKIELVAPAVIEIKAGLVHKITALKASRWFCIHDDDNYNVELINIEES